MDNLTQEYNFWLNKTWELVNLMGSQAWTRRYMIVHVLSITGVRRAVSQRHLGPMEMLGSMCTGPTWLIFSGFCLTIFLEGTISGKFLLIRKENWESSSSFSCPGKLWKRWPEHIAMNILRCFKVTMQWAFTKNIVFRPKRWATIYPAACTAFVQ